MRMDSIISSSLYIGDKRNDMGKYRSVLSFARHLDTSPPFIAMLKKWPTASALSTAQFTPPKNAKNPEEITSVRFLELFRFADRKDKWLMGFSTVCSFLAGQNAFANTILFGRMTDAFIIQGQAQYDHEVNSTIDHNLMDAVTSFSVNNSILGAFLLFLSYVSTTIFSYAAQRQITRIRDLYLRSALYQEVAWYDENSTGNFSSRMAEDLSKLEEGIGEKVTGFAFLMGSFCGSIGLALIQGWKLALICLTSIPVAAAIMATLTFLSTRLCKNELDAYGAAGAIADEVLGSIRTVAAFAGEKKELQRYEKYLHVAKDNNIKRHIFTGLGYAALLLMMYLSYALAFWYGFKMIFDERQLPVDQQTYTAGVLTSVFYSVILGNIALGQCLPYLDIFITAKSAGVRVFAVIDRKSAIDSSKQVGKQPTQMNGNIEFRNVSFHYPSRAKVSVLSNFCLRVNKGETVALVGTSGCGKSTCIQLLQRFYDPCEGQVLIDGNDIRDLNLKWLRSRIGVVGQEPVLFATTVAENIRYAREEASMAEVKAAAVMSNAHGFISKLPMGYNTVVGERGAEMSGGQKQRVAIARALLRNPDILLLDEATSALDNASEACVQRALEKASEGRTTIIVAHRLSTIRHADKIVVLDGGVVVEQGTHMQLMARKSHYYKLAQAQMAIPDEEELTLGDAGLRPRYSRQISSYSRTSKVSISIDDNGEEFVEDSEYCEEDDKEGPAPLWEVIKLNSPEWKAVLIGTIASMILGSSAPIFSVIFGNIMGVLVEPQWMARRDTNMYCLYYVLVGVCVGFACFLMMYAYGVAGEYLTMRLRYRALAAMLRQEIAWFDMKNNCVGALCARLSGDASAVQGATGQRIGAIVQSLTTLILALSFSLTYEWRIGLVALAFTPVILISTFFMVRIMNDNAFGTSDAMERSTKIAVEAVSNIRTVAGLCREEAFHKKYMEALKPIEAMAAKNNQMRGIITGVSRSITYFAFSACIYYGGILMVKENLEYSTVLKASHPLITGTLVIGNVFAFAPNFQKGLSSAAQLFKLLSRVPRIGAEPIFQRRSSTWKQVGSVTYEKVHFRYPTRPTVEVLRDLTLIVPNGKTVALVGQSGCGKSTLIQLLERFYDATDGRITLDKQDVDRMSLQTLRSQLGIVSQEPVLFDRTIEDNIKYGDNSKDVSTEDVIDAAKKANIHNFVMSLPMGYQTRIGERGVQLSGGQKQRIAIARALIRNPRVLLLDEATSALDSESEKVVQAALDAARKGRTCITIAHRLSTIQDADVICVISKGRVVEKGTHTELIQKRGIYHQLYMLQAGPNPSALTP